MPNQHAGLTMPNEVLLQSSADDLLGNGGAYLASIGGAAGKWSSFQFNNYSSEAGTVQNDHQLPSLLGDEADDDMPCLLAVIDGWASLESPAAGSKQHLGSSVANSPEYTVPVASQCHPETPCSGLPDLQQDCDMGIEAALLQPASYEPKALSGQYAASKDRYMTSAFSQDSTFVIEALGEPPADEVEIVGPFYSSFDTLQNVAAKARNKTSRWIQPSGPRQQGQGVENEEQGIMSLDRLDDGQVTLKITLLAAGFVIGPGGCSIQSIVRASGCNIKSGTDPAQTHGGRPSRVFLLEGDKHATRVALEIIYEAVERYKYLCEGKCMGQAVNRIQKIRGLEFCYKPPPRHLVPYAASLRPPTEQKGQRVRQSNSHVGYLSPFVAQSCSQAETLSSTDFVHNTLMLHEEIRMRQLLANDQHLRSDIPGGFPMETSLHLPVHSRGTSNQFHQLGYPNELSGGYTLQPNASMQLEQHQFSSTEPVNNSEAGSSFFCRGRQLASGTFDSFHFLQGLQPPHMGRRADTLSHSTHLTSIPRTSQLRMQHIPSSIHCSGLSTGAGVIPIAFTPESSAGYARRPGPRFFPPHSPTENYSTSGPLSSANVGDEQYHLIC